MKMRLLVIHGPNLNLLGKREPEIYGTQSLDQLNAELQSYAEKNGVELTVEQSNSEGAIIELLHDAMNWADGVILNPAAYTHYSYAIYDAVKAIGLPVIEVHLSDIHARESFRSQSVIAPACTAQIAGFGIRSYIKAIDLLRERS